MTTIETSPPVSAFDVLREFERLAGERITRTKSLKLLALAQAWHYVECDRPLFRETIEAWKLGPVVPEVYRGQNPPPTQPLSPGQQSLVFTVFHRYGDLSGSRLTEETHKWRAWRNAWRDRTRPSQGNEPVDMTSVRDQLLKEAEDDKRAILEALGA